MWICTACNQLVPDPVRRKCPNGHILFDWSILAPTKDLPAVKSFFNALLICLGVVVAVTSINALVPSKPFGNALGYVLVFFIAFGIVVLRRGRKWKRQGGPVARLAPLTLGIALGCIFTGAGMFALGITVNLIR